MAGAGVPDGRGLAPLECPIATLDLEGCSAFLRMVFVLINEARLTGSLNLLETAEGMIKAALEKPARSGDQESIPSDLALKAALGECYSVRGRWLGDRDPDKGRRPTGREALEEGVQLIRIFVDWIDENVGNLNDGPATQIRAHAFLGNAMTRLAYFTREHQDLARAFDQLESQGERFDSLGSYKAVAGPFFAAWERDTGDIHVGILHWSASTDEICIDNKMMPVNIDGVGIQHLKRSSKEFARLYRSSTDATTLAEWAASESSLVVARAQTAKLLVGGELNNPNALTPTDEFLGLGGGQLKGLSESGRAKARAQAAASKVEELVRDARDGAFRVWRVYLGLLHQPVTPSFRWARSISNIAFGLMYLVEIMDARKSVAEAALAEVAFRSVLDINDSPAEPRAIKTDFDYMWYGRLLAGGRSLRSVHYGDDHEERCAVNEAGLATLMHLLSRNGVEYAKSKGE
ncbi:MAG: hypothetical protein AAFY15_01785 [Cyanobacteria bacterium J06648_11]